VFANAGTAFFTSLAGILTMDSIMGVGIGFNEMIVAGLAVGGIQAGLAFFTELKDEIEGNPVKKKVKKKHRSMLLLF